MLDEVPVSFVTPMRDATDDLVQRIQDACALALASFKQPHGIRLTADLLRSMVEKVATAELRALLARD
ncbi:hypothetical protein [Phenylobacterium sp.]|uniref:hypothetical protein n=1 Tax=Phenylobacterium sp. TaxID=1871053 RepID=UPI00289F15BD|nr:hypothetical protein [Phenylobacterium sp.]